MLQHNDQGHKQTTTKEWHILLEFSLCVCGGNSLSVTSYVYIITVLFCLLLAFDGLEVETMTCDIRLKGYISCF